MKIAETFVRGVRNEAQIESLLQQRFKISNDALAPIMSALKQAKELFSGKPRTKLQKTEASQAKTDIDLVAEEQKLLDERLAALTRRMPQKSTEPAIGVGQVSAARTKAEELALQKAKIDEDKLTAARVASRPEKARAKLSLPSLPPESEAKVTDIKYARTLAGPVEELQMMTPTEFRRLSSDPLQAALKIEDKLSLLESTAYEERIRGLKAWRESPINQLYLQMTRESLINGVSIAEIAARRRNAGEESLSPAEISALVALNNRLKF